MSYQHVFFEDFFERLSSLHDQIKQAIKDLPTEALVWVPGEDMNSIAVLVTHTCGAEQFWVEAMAGNVESNRVRADEFKVTEATEQSLLNLLDKTLATSKTTLETLTLDDLPTERYGEAWDRHFRNAWSLLHALDHSATHVGHIQITRQLWEQQ